MAQPPAVPTTLVPELLGFSPQMLLDDIINTAADAILQCQQAMEPFMQRWADARTEKVGEEWDGLEVVEQVRHGNSMKSVDVLVLIFTGLSCFLNTPRVLHGHCI